MGNCLTEISTVWAYNPKELQQFLSEWDCSRHDQDRKWPGSTAGFIPTSVRKIW